MGKENSNMKTGIIAAYFSDKGYGFIKDSDAQRFKHWFFHVHNCLVEPRIGLRVQFNIGEGRKGPMAIDINVDVAQVLVDAAKAAQ